MILAIAGCSGDGSSNGSAEGSSGNSVTDGSPTSGSASGGADASAPSTKVDGGASTDNSELCLYSALDGERDGVHEDLGGCTLRAAGDAAGVRVGSAMSPDLIDDPDYERVASEFSSLTPENHMKWTLVHPGPEVWDFEGADRLVDFAEAHDMAVRGHTLVWGQAVGNGVPDWLLEVDDPDELAAVVDGHISELVGRYAGRVDRWDVVNEPLESVGADLDANHFLEVLGPGYIASAFESAHRADPEALLYINEHSVEFIPEKAEALFTLVEGLLADGVPVHGVGLQSHQFAGRPAEPGALEAIVKRFTDMGLEVAITELDLPIADGGDLDSQAAGYRQLVGECLRAGCSEITVWGVHDGVTWLDSFLGRQNTSPLLFDRELSRKPSHAAVVDQLLAWANEQQTSDRG